MAKFELVVAAEVQVAFAVAKFELVVAAEA